MQTQTEVEKSWNEIFSKSKLPYPSEYFYDFKFADIHDNCFGFNYHWFITVCKKK